MRSLLRLSLTYYWRTNLAVVLGVIAASAALTGALLVGDSMRGSLQTAALERLGRIEHALVAPRFLREALAGEIADELGADSGARVCPVILTRGAATHAESQASVHRANVIGADARFWGLGDVDEPGADGRSVVLNQPLADELHASVGDDVLLRLGKAGDVSAETLLGRRDDTTVTLRLTVVGVLPARSLGAFNLWPQQRPPRNAYVPLATLQRLLQQDGQVNALLTTGVERATLDDALRRRIRLEDVGLRLCLDEARGYVSVESDGFLLTPAVEETVREAAEELDSAVGVLAHLANEIAVVGRPNTVIPYSTVAAVAPDARLLGRLTLVDGSTVEGLATGEALLNEWAAEDLAARPGDEIQLSYYTMATAGELRTETATFRVCGVVRLDEPAADPGFVPEYPGVTDAESLGDWDPPFPLDLKKLRPKDEEYWRQYRATPKVFVSLADGQRLWATQAERFGRLTSLRLYPSSDVVVAEFREAFTYLLARYLGPARHGLHFDDVRRQALAASRGATDFGGLFIGFSFFLIAAAAMLVALLFRLGIERRAGEVGLLLALGYAPRQVARLFLIEGTLLAAIGAALGLPVACGYAGLMLAGLRTWWSAAVNTPFLELHGTAASYVVGYVISLLVTVLSIWWSLRGLTRLSPRALLAGVVQTGRPATRRQGRIAVVVIVVAVLLGGGLCLLTLTTGAVSQSAAFFGGGVALLVALLAGLVQWLGGESGATIHARGIPALLRLGMRNARRRAGRSALIAGLIACAVFNITALQAMRLEPPAPSQAKNSATGGFALLGEAAVPLPFVPDDSRLIPFRLRIGDETSCLNVYRPRQPRLLGALEVMINRGGFLFSKTLGVTVEEQRNPWRLLERTYSDGAIPVMLDEAAALWQLHIGLGEDLIITDESGREARLRVVALLKGSPLQGEAIVAEGQFLRLFPSVSGYGYLLVDVPPENAAVVEKELEREYAAYSLGLNTTWQRLEELMAVQNTYLSTFQMLGGLGLLLGTVGLAAVLLRNVWERRGELALLQALGFSRMALGWLVLSENAVLVLAGLLIGFVSAAVVVTPHAFGRVGAIPWLSLAGMYLLVLFIGFFAGVLALIPALRGRLLPALRSE
ncbi:MAG: ABC transporter permease [Planctomycetota bacterium]